MERSRGDSHSGVRWARRARRWLVPAIALALLAAAIGPGIPAIRAAEPSAILILTSTDSRLPASRVIGDSLQATLRAGLDGDEQIFLEYLDLLRFTDAEYRVDLATFLRRKYVGQSFDLVFASGPQALEFVTQFRTPDFLAAPVVYLGIRKASSAQLPLLSGATGIVSKFDLLTTVKLAQILQPTLQHLYVVTGSASFDRSWDRTARAELAALEPGLAISYLAGRRVDDLLAELATLPDQSAVLYLSMMEDADGRALVPADIAEQVAAAANAPVYGVYSSYVGRGIVGGFMETFESIGEAAGRLGLRILRGEQVANVEPQNDETQAFVVDWRAMRRWSLDGNALPAESVILHRDISIWGQYRQQILVLIGLLLLQTMLIAALLAQGRRRRQAETSLSESEDRMSLAASSANLGMWRWDVASDQIWMTDHCREILGLPPQSELRLDELLSAVHPDDRSSMSSQIQNALRRGEAFDTEHRIIMPDQEVRWVSTKGRSTHGSLPRLRRVTGVVIDVTERKHAQMEADQQRQQIAHLTRVAILGELSGALAHELNQPLSAILSNAQAAQEILKRESPDIEEMRAILEDIVADDLRAGEVIRRLRAMLKRDDAKFERLDVNRLIGEVLGIAGSQIVMNQVALQTRLSPALPAIRGDRIQLQQVLLNLVVNACEAMHQAMPTDRILAVSTQGSGSRGVEILVRDSGTGMPGEVERRLFEPFFTTKEKGLGLGLSISRAIVAAHKGHIRAANNDDRGATFSILLLADG